MARTCTVIVAHKQSSCSALNNACSAVSFHRSHTLDWKTWVCKTQVLSHYHNRLYTVAAAVRSLYRPTRGAVQHTVNLDKCFHKHMPSMHTASQLHHTRQPASPAASLPPAPPVLPTGLALARARPCAHRRLRPPRQGFSRSRSPHGPRVWPWPVARPAAPCCRTRAGPAG